MGERIAHSLAKVRTDCKITGITYQDQERRQDLGTGVRIGTRAKVGVDHEPEMS